MRGENMLKTRLLCCQIATILVLLEEIGVAEHDGEGSFYTGSRIDAISVHAHWRNRQNIAKMYSERRVIPLLQEMGVAEANGEVRFLTGSS